MCINNSEVKRYDGLNEFANKHSVVVLGSTFMSNIPMSELKQSFGIHSDIYNRSLTDLRIDEATDVLKNIMDTLSPKKVVLHLGEIELRDSEANISVLIYQMKELIDIIKNSDKHCKIVLVSEANNEFDTKLEELAKNTKCQFADITSGSTKDESIYINAFMKLKCFLADDISEAFSFVTY